MEAAALLSKSRLDWQVELSKTLHLWLVSPESDRRHAHLILGWANVGALVEGTMKWFLSVFFSDYANSIDALKSRRTGIAISPDEQSLEPLRQFFHKQIWERGDRWNKWVELVQSRRNAVHAFKHRELGTHPELVEAIEDYFDFLTEHEGRVPYPDENPWSHYR